jgi:hypothetical protein
LSLIKYEDDTIVPESEDPDNSEDSNSLQSYLSAITNRIQADEGAIRVNSNSNHNLEIQIRDLRRDVRTLQKNVAASDNLEISRTIQVGLSGEEVVYTWLQDSYYFMQTRNTIGPVDDRSKWYNLYNKARTPGNIENLNIESRIKKQLPNDLPLVVRSTRYVMPTKMDFWITIVEADPGAGVWATYQGSRLTDIPTMTGTGILVGGDTVNLLDTGWVSIKTAETRRIRPIDVSESIFEYLLVLMSMVSMLIFPFVEVGVAATLGVEVVTEGLTWIIESKALRQAIQNERAQAEFGQVRSDGLVFSEQFMEWSYNEIYKMNTTLGPVEVQGYRPDLPADTYNLNWMDRYPEDAPKSGWIDFSDEYHEGDFTNNDIANVKAVISRGAASEWYNAETDTVFGGLGVRYRKVSVMRIVKSSVAETFAKEVTGPTTSLPYSYSKVVPRNLIEDFNGNTHSSYYSIFIGSDTNPNKARWYAWWDGATWQTDDSVFTRLE